MNDLYNFIKENAQEIYVITFKFPYHKKCNKCNEDREIVVKNILGTEFKEKCDCYYKEKFPVVSVWEKVLYKNKEFLFEYRKEDGWILMSPIEKHKFNCLDNLSYHESINKILDNLQFYFDTKWCSFKNKDKAKEFCLKYLIDNMDLIEEEDFHKINDMIESI